MFIGKSHVFLLAVFGLLIDDSPAYPQGNDLLRGVLQGMANQAIRQEIARVQPPTASGDHSIREDNRLVQHALNRKGFDAGFADGILGKRSYAAIARFQSANGHAATGTLTASQKAQLLGGAGLAVQIPVLPLILPETGGVRTARPSTASNRSTRRTSRLPSGTTDGTGDRQALPTATQSPQLMLPTGTLPIFKNSRRAPATTASTGGTLVPLPTDPGTRTEGSARSRDAARREMPTTGGPTSAKVTAPADNTGALRVVPGPRQTLCTSEMTAAGTCTDPAALRRGARGGG